MTVKQLKEILNQYKDDTEVLITSDNFELKNSLVPIFGIYESRMKKVQKVFRDFFDGESYFENVYVLDENGEDTLVIYD